MPYLPQRRFRPAGTRRGNYRPPRSVAQRPGFQDTTMPKWLRDALAGGASQPPPGQPTPTPTPQQRVNYPTPDQAAEQVDAITGAGAFVPDRGPGGQPSYQPGGFYGRDQGQEYMDAVGARGRGSGVVRDQAGGFDFGDFFGGIGDTLASNRADNLGLLNSLFSPDRFERKPGIMGKIQEFFAPEARETDYTQRGGGFMGVGMGEALNFLGDFVLPGTGNLPQPGGAGAPDRGGGGTFFEQGNNRANLEALSSLLGIPVDDLYNRGANPTQIPGPFQTGNIMQDAWLSSFANQNPPDYGTSDAPVAFSGAGGGGGGGLGGFNFAPGDPADPSFWMDMVRWLIQ